jgi:YfiH family protein
MSELEWIHVGDPIEYLELRLFAPFRAYFTTKRITDPRTIPDVKEISWLVQVHGSDILQVKKPIYGTLTGDGQVTDHRGLFLGVRVADCFPVYLLDPLVPCLGLAHAGWRSSAARIVEKVVKLMVRSFGAEQDRMIAAFGPGICVEHYEVNPDFWSTFGGFVRSREDKVCLDLEGFNRSILIENGLKEENIIPSPFCTFEHPDLFFSHRRDGGIMGEMWALLGMD